MMILAARVALAAAERGEKALPCRRAPGTESGQQLASAAAIDSNYVYSNKAYVSAGGQSAGGRVFADVRRHFPDYTKGHEATARADYLAEVEAAGQGDPG